MEFKLIGSIWLPIWGELSNLAQGSDKLIIPCGWPQTVQYNSGKAWVWFHSASTVAHAFDFFENGSGSAIASVTYPASTSGFVIGTLTLAAGGLLGLTDYLSVRHSTNAQNANESGSHVDEGGRIFAGIIPDGLVW